MTQPGPASPATVRWFPASIQKSNLTALVGTAMAMHIKDGRNMIAKVNHLFILAKKDYMVRPYSFFDF
jgi:hypothetical protein